MQSQINTRWISQAYLSNINHNQQDKLKSCIKIDRLIKPLKDVYGMIEVFKVAAKIPTQTLKLS